MKKFILILTLAFIHFLGFSQCTPNALYQDSMYSIWPDTVQNLPHATQGVNYFTQIDLKTPTTLIEASGGDSSLTTIDTLGNTYYIGNWPVDSMIMVSTSGLPNGLILDCNTPNCSYEGDVVGCVNVYGTTNDPIGIYPITIEVNVYTHGTLTVFGIPVPVQTDLYSALGDYEHIDGYKIVVNSSTGLEVFHEQDFVVFQNTPNPFNDHTSIKFNTPKSDDLVFEIIDMFGRKVFSDVFLASKGVNTYQFNHDLASGIYIYNINNGQEMITKRMIVAEK